MLQAKSHKGRCSSGKAAFSRVDIRPLFAPIENILASDGDRRLSLSALSRQNIYGCTPYPREGMMDLASSTASSISEEAYARARAVRENYLSRVIRDGAERALEETIGNIRQTLLEQLGLQATGAEVIFAASGTDAQLLALFIAKSLLGAPLTTVIVGADQTGSGTTYTARGQHFSDVTAHGYQVGKGDAIPGLADDVSNINVPFFDGTRFRTPAQMDCAVLEAVRTTVAGGARVLLQIMDASKFGWRAPSEDCIAQIMKQWPDDVQIVVDACQLRVSHDRLAAMLQSGSMVLITGSKFFTGPAFSGALLVPPMLCAEAARTNQIPSGLPAYTSRCDWPQSWEGIRNHLPYRANFGQWLRWEAALEEMRLYHAVPFHFREELRVLFTDHITRLLASSAALQLLLSGAEPNDTTMFPVLPHWEGIPLTSEQCAAIYQAMRRDLGTVDDAEPENLMIRMLCQLGQPVPLAAGSALRISLSARTIRRCWSSGQRPDTSSVDQTLGDVATLIEKLDYCARHIDDFMATAR